MDLPIISKLTIHLTPYSYEEAKDRANRVSQEHKNAFASIQEKFKPKMNDELRSRDRLKEIQKPLNFKPKDQTTRLNSIEKIPYDNEGFNISFYRSYRFRDEANPKKIMDSKRKFQIDTKSRFATFDQMRRS